MSKRKKQAKGSGKAKNQRALPEANVLTAPFWIGTRDSRPILSVHEDGELMLYNPQTGEPRIRMGDLRLVEQGARGNVIIPACGVEILKPDGTVAAALCYSEYERGENAGRLLLYGAPELAAAELTAFPEGDGSMTLLAPAPGFPGHTGAEIRTRKGAGHVTFSAHDGGTVSLGIDGK